MTLFVIEYTLPIRFYTEEDSVRVIQVVVNQKERIGVWLNSV